jgi:protein phosphatase
LRQREGEPVRIGLRREPHANKLRTPDDDLFIGRLDHQRLRRRLRLGPTRGEVPDVVDRFGHINTLPGVAWWEELTSRGGEGMVVKPIDFLPGRGQKHPVQPALKVRGPEYLRIIYGPEYTLPEHLERLRERGVAGKRSLAHREFALGIEGLERFIRREPLRRVHECVFGVLALESEPVDPRL